MLLSFPRLSLVSAAGEKSQVIKSEGKISIILEAVHFLTDALCMRIFPYLNVVQRLEVFFGIFHVSVKVGGNFELFSEIANQILPTDFKCFLWSNFPGC